MKHFFALLLILAFVKSYAQKQRYSKDELRSIVSSQQIKINELEVDVSRLSDLNKKYLKADQDKFECLNKLSLLSDSLRIKNQYIDDKIQENQYLQAYVKQLKEELSQKDQVVSANSQQLIKSPTAIKKTRYSLSNDDSTPTYRPSRRTYITGPRGGCYYINGNGNKTYVDRSLCN